MMLMRDKFKKHSTVDINPTIGLMLQCYHHYGVILISYHETSVKLK